MHMHILLAFKINIFELKNHVHFLFSYYKL